MNLPFSTEQFFQVFESYNRSIWPAQLIAYLLGLVAVYLAMRHAKVSKRSSDKVISGVLGLFWIWMGVAYHIAHFSSINIAANLFGALFAAQGIMFFVDGVCTSRLSFRFRWDLMSLTGGVFILYAMLIYPIIGYFLGHAYPQSPVFGVAPCPTTIFTFGLLLWAGSRVPTRIIVIPLIWSFIGFSAALTLGVREDIGLLAAGIIGTFMILLRKKQTQRKQALQLTC